MTRALSPAVTVRVRNCDGQELLWYSRSVTITRATSVKSIWTPEKSRQVESTGTNIRAYEISLIFNTRGENLSRSAPTAPYTLQRRSLSISAALCDACLRNRSARRSPVGKVCVAAHKGDDFSYAGMAGCIEANLSLSRRRLDDLRAAHRVKERRGVLPGRKLAHRKASGFGSVL